jgi:hypothetical protein
MDERSSRDVFSPTSIDYGARVGFNWLRASVKGFDMKKIMVVSSKIKVKGERN